MDKSEAANVPFHKRIPQLKRKFHQLNCGRVTKNIETVGHEKWFRTKMACLLSKSYTRFFSSRGPPTLVGYRICQLLRVSVVIVHAWTREMTTAVSFLDPLQPIWNKQGPGLHFSAGPCTPPVCQDPETCLSSPGISVSTDLVLLNSVVEYSAVEPKFMCLMHSEAKQTEMF